MEINPAAASLSPAAINSVGDAARAASTAASARTSSSGTPGASLDRELLSRLRTMATWDAGSVVGDIPSMTKLIADVRERMLAAPRHAVQNTHALMGDRVRGLLGG